MRRILIYEHISSVIRENMLKGSGSKKKKKNEDTSTEQQLWPELKKAPGRRVNSL